MYDLSELKALAVSCLLMEWDIDLHNLYDGKQVVLRNDCGDILNDAVIHMSSYGHNKGLLETWDSDMDSVGCLTAQEVFSIWAENIKTNKSYVAK